MMLGHENEGDLRDPCTSIQPNILLLPLLGVQDSTLRNIVEGEEQVHCSLIDSLQ